VAIYFAHPKGQSKADGQVRAFNTDGLQRFFEIDRNRQGWFSQLASERGGRPLQC